MCVYLCVRLSNAATASKRIDISSNFFDIVAGHNSSFTRTPHRLQDFSGNSLSGALNTRGGKILQISPFISETVRDWAIVTMEH